MILEEGPLHRMVFSIVARIWRVVPAVPVGDADWAKPVLLVLVLAGQVGGTVGGQMGGRQGSVAS